LLLDEFFGVDLVLIHEDLDEVDEGQNGADAEAAAHNDFEDALLGLAHHEVVDAEAAQEEADEGHGDLILAAQIAGSGSLLGADAAVQADVCTGRQFLAAVVAESGAHTDLHAALHTNFLIFVDLNAAVFAICHIYSSSSIGIVVLDAHLKSV